MKTRKTFFIIMLTLIVYITNGGIATAQDIQEEGIKKEDNLNFITEKIIINEYEVLKELNKEYNYAKEKNELSINETFNKFTAEDILMIENFKDEYLDKIYGLKSWNLGDLKRAGYTEEQIDAIKNFDGSERMLIQASTRIHVDIGFRNLVRSNSRTTVDLISSFNCYGLVQSNWFNDIFTVVFNTPFSVSRRTATLRYYRPENQSNSYTYPTVLNNGLYGVEIKFPKYHDSSGAHYIHSGSIVLGLTSNSYVFDLQALAKYGYTTFGVPSATIGWPPSISFSSGTREIGQAYTYE